MTFFYLHLVSFIAFWLESVHEKQCTGKRTECCVWKCGTENQYMYYRMECVHQKYFTGLTYFTFSQGGIIWGCENIRIHDQMTKKKKQINQPTNQQQQQQQQRQKPKK